MLRSTGGVLLLALLVAGGCSRLSFIRPDPGTKEFERVSVSQPVEVRESPAAEQRTAVRNRLLLAQREIMRSNLDGAEREAREALKIDGSSSDAYTLLAVVEERRGRRAEAGGYYQRAAELAPKNGGALNNYGAWLCSNGRAGESLVWFERALQDPSYATPASALANSGACADEIGQGARAERELRAAIELDPQNAVALAALAQLHFRAGRYMDARAFSERRLAAAPADARALQLASQIEHKLGDTAAAARYVQRLGEEFPGAVPGNPGGSTQR